MINSLIIFWKTYISVGMLNCRVIEWAVKQINVFVCGVVWGEKVVSETHSAILAAW